MLGDIEDVTHEIAKLFLADSFATLLGTIDAAKNTQQGVNVFTPRPAEVWEAQKASPTLYPSCFLVPVQTEFDQESNPTLQDCTHLMQVIWFLQGDDEVVIAKQLERLVLATRSTLWNSVLGGIVNACPIRVIREDYSELAPNADGSAFMKGASVWIQVPVLVQ